MEFPKGELIHLRRSAFHTIEVLQSDGIRFLRTDRYAVQSALNLERPQQLILPYMQAMMAGLLFQRPAESVLLLGLGGGDLVRCLHHHLPRTRVTTVEIDSAMVAVCRDWFALPESDKLRICIDDASHFLGHDQGRYELLLVDIYSGAEVPGPFFDNGFYRRCYDRLKENGMLVINLITDDAATFKAILRRLRRQFDCATLCLTVSGHINIIVFAFRQRPARLTLPALSEQAVQLSKQFELDFAGWARQLFSTNPTEGGELIF